jgi:hypothetical protein
MINSEVSEGCSLFRGGCLSVFITFEFSWSIDFEAGKEQTIRGCEYCHSAKKTCLLQSNLAILHIFACSNP